jgi:outer membrane biosynthesis protein TonB
MLVKGLAVRQMPLPSFQVSVPFEGGGADQAGGGAADSTPKGQYIRKVKQAVEKKWHLYRALGRERLSPGALLVQFYVNKEGKVEDFKRVEDKESNDWLNDSTARAIRDAEIPPIPPEVLETLPIMDKQRLKIEYNVLIY